MPAHNQLAGKWLAFLSSFFFLSFLSFFFPCFFFLPLPFLSLELLLSKLGCLKWLPHSFSKKQNKLVHSQYSLVVMDAAQSGFISLQDFDRKGWTQVNCNHLQSPEITCGPLKSSELIQIHYIIYNHLTHLNSSQLIKPNISSDIAKVLRLRVGPIAWAHTQPPMHAPRSPRPNYPSSHPFIYPSTHPSTHSPNTIAKAKATAHIVPYVAAH